jgi:Tfp pilus assembly protein PilN
MIKINLLGVPKAVERVAPEAAALAPAAILLSGALFVALGLVAVIMYFYMLGRIRDLDSKIETAKREKDRLAPVRAQEQSYRQTLADLKQHEDTIDQLAKSRVGPVELMRSLGVNATRTNDLYLLNVGQTGGRLTISGQANSVESIADFLAALVQSNSFEDVQLRQEYQDNKGAKLGFKFGIDCVFKPSTSVAETSAGQAGPTPAPPGRRVGL